MAKRSGTSLHWLTLAVVLPLLVLIVLAALGLDSQARAALAAKEDEANRDAQVAADLLAQAFARAEIRFQRFPDPPVPGSPSPLDAVLEGKDLPALEAMSKSPDAGVSPAGLPRRALAALRLMELDSRRIERDPDEGRRIAKVLTEECPSVLTGKCLDWFGPHYSPETERWELFLEALRLLGEKPSGGWMMEGDSISWIQPEDDHIVFASLSWLDPGLRLIQPTSPEGFRVLPTTSTASANSMGAGPFAVAPVPFGNGLRIEAYPVDQRGIGKKILRQQIWTLSLLALASAISLFGLFLLHRTLRRERQLSDMKSQFVASVSHELRAPVASIRLMADALEAEKVAPETAKEFHRLISRESARLSTLVGNVLDHARIEQGRRVWKMEPCDLSSLVADTLRVMEPLAKEKDITLRSSLSQVDAAVDADAIQQALVNLLDNAIKFSPPGSTVETSLSINEERRTWEISVRDEGPGIPKEEQGRIFERFYRPGDELRRETQGTGIGLSLVKAIAEAHGGSVSVESELGQGSTFTLTLPF